MSHFTNPAPGNATGAKTYGLSTRRVRRWQQMSEDLPRVLEFQPCRQFQTSEPGDKYELNILQWFNKQDVESIKRVQHISKDNKQYINYEIAFWDPRVAAELVPNRTAKNPDPSQNLVIPVGANDTDVGTLRWAGRAYRPVSDKVLRITELYPGFSRAYYLLTRTHDPSAWPRRPDGFRYLFPWELKNLVRNYYQEVTKGRSVGYPEPQFKLDSRGYGYVEFYDTATAFAVLERLLQGHSSGIGDYEFKELERFDFERTVRAAPTIAKQELEQDIRRERPPNSSSWSNSPEPSVTPPPPYSPPRASTAHHAQTPPHQSSLRRLVATMITDTCTGKVFWTGNWVEDSQRYTVDRVKERYAQGDLQRMEIRTPGGKSQEVYVKTLCEDVLSPK